MARFARQRQLPAALSEALWPFMASMNQASQDRLHEIEAWFLTHKVGEFAAAPSDYSSVRIGDAATARTIVYTTKHQCLSRIRNLTQLPKPIAMLGRYGLPAADDLPFVCGSSPTRIFIGDCDPPDILVFAGSGSICQSSGTE